VNSPSASLAHVTFLDMTSVTTTAAPSVTSPMGLSVREEDWLCCSGVANALTCHVPSSMRA